MRHEMDIVLKEKFNIISVLLTVVILNMMVLQVIVALYK